MGPKWGAALVDLKTDISRLPTVVSYTGNVMLIAISVVSM
jgi:hypothetical protein